MGYKEIMMDLEGIRQEVENAPQKELKHNLNKVSNKLLKCEREKVYGLCLSAVSVLGAVGGLVMAFAPSSTLKGIGLCLLGTGILGGVATYYKNKKTDFNIQKFNDLKEVLEDELEFRNMNSNE